MRRLLHLPYFFCLIAMAFALPTASWAQEGEAAEAEEAGQVEEAAEEAPAEEGADESSDDGDEGGEESADEGGDESAE